MTDLELERLLADGRSAEHLAPADRVAAARLRADADAFLDRADVDVRVARIAAALPSRRPMPWLAALAAAAVAVWWMARPAPEPERAAIAAPVLAIAVDTGDGAFPLSPAAVVDVGDTLRFAVDAPSGYLAIVAPPAVLVAPTAFEPGTGLATVVSWTGERDVYAIYGRTTFDVATIARGAPLPPWLVASRPIHLRAMPRPQVFDVPVNSD
jgi:hypothetical protein